MQELAPERRAVREAIESLRLTPVMFELGARPASAARALPRLSGAERRFRWTVLGELRVGAAGRGAVRLGGRVPPVRRPAEAHLPETPAPERQPRLDELIARIQRDDSVSYRPFGAADELRTLVADDLAVLLTERFAATAEVRAGADRSTHIAPLPRPVTRLIGRDRDVALVLDLLVNPDVRMVTIVGPGGIGKSRLALAVAEGARERCPDGISYIDLAPLTEPSLVLPTIAKSLGIEEQTGTSVGTQLRGRLAEARMMIVLDNMEQLAEAASDVSDLLEATQALVLLVTSRRLLDVRGERIYTLGPLAVPADEAVTAAVELFLERARSIHPGYQPTATDLAAFSELSRRLDGLPLAIELAAAWLRVLSPRALQQRMGYQRLEFLREGARDLPARQRTLRDTIAWSHSLLSADAKLLFARLAVFVGGADLEAIDQVTNPDGRLDTLDVIAELVDQSLVRALGEAAEPRFGMLETIREFAVERLEESGTADDYRARHQAHYLELAERGHAALGTAAQVEWLERLPRDNDNSRAVLRRALRREDAASALRMGRALASYWYISGSYGEGRSWMEQVAGLPSAPPYERAMAWMIGAIQAFHAGRFRGDRHPPGRGPAPRRRGRGQAHRGVRPVTAGDRTGRRVR